MPAERLIFRLNVWRSRASNKVWIEPAVSVVIAFILCSLTWFLDQVIHPANVPTVALEGVTNILNIISTSMLTVATFALGTVVTALALAATSQTPRATELMIEDEGGRASISAFIGSFVFAVSAQTALAFGLYGPVGQLVLLVITLIVLAYVVSRLVLFIRTMTRLGQMSDTIDRLTEATRDSLRRYRQNPYPTPQRPGKQLVDATVVARVHFHQTGYLTHLDIGHLSSIADRFGGVLHVQARPGAFVTPDREAAVIECSGDHDVTVTDDDRDDIRSSFVIDTNRSYDHDPRFGFIALSEIAQRALSPAINDPGTAIAVANAVATIILNPEHDRAPTLRDRSLAPTTDLSKVTNVTVVPLDEGEFVHDAYAPIARDGAHNTQVLIRVLKLLAALAANTDGNIRRAALDEAEVLLQRAELGLQLASDRQAVERVYRELFADSPT